MLNVAIALLLLVAATSLAFGFKYLFAKEYMPYHAAVAQSPWSQVPDRLQAVMLGMLKVVSAGLLVFGLSLIWLTVPFSRGEDWATWAIMSITAVNGVITIYVTVALRRLEPTAKTPIIPAAAAVVIVALALVLARLA